MGDALKAPFPWFGGKTICTPEVWRRFGDVKNYVEPFFGGGAMLLGRPPPTDDTIRIETINDINAYLCNFWRAVKADPGLVAYYAADPVNEIDLHARGDALFYKGVLVNGGKLTPDEFAERLRGDAEWYNAKVAGWWVWGQSSWIGDNWGKRACHSVPSLGNFGKGVNRKLPSLGAGKGVNRKLPHLGSYGGGVNQPTLGVNRKLPAPPPDNGDITGTSRLAGIAVYFQQLAERLARVRICCGDYLRVLSNSALLKQHGYTGVFLDPPYCCGKRSKVYSEHDSLDLSAAVRQWCIEHAADDGLRLALCGQGEEHAELEGLGWTTFFWQRKGGYKRRAGTAQKTAEQQTETVWFSPGCLPATKP
jgi:site-specific DNA-adenine methylase